MKRIASSRRLVLFALAAFFVAGLVGQLQAVDGMTGGYIFVYTYKAQQRTASGECYDPANTIQNICVEMCFLSTDGHTLPTGEFMCVPPQGWV